MSFGGGGGSTGVSNHVHNNLTGEGGALKLDQSSDNSNTKIMIGSDTTEYPLDILLA